MDRKIIWLGMSVGGFVGGFIPLLWGANEFSFASILWSGIGGFLGIWIGVKMSQ